MGPGKAKEYKLEVNIQINREKKKKQQWKCLTPLEIYSVELGMGT